MEMNLNNEQSINLGNMLDDNMQVRMEVSDGGEVTLESGAIHVDELVVPLDVFKDIVNSASKVGDYSEEIAQVITLDFNKSGLIARASNKFMDFEYNYSSYSYNQDVHMSIDIKKLRDLLNTLDGSYNVKLEFDDNNGVVTMYVGENLEGVYQIPKRMDASTYEDIVIELRADLPYSEMHNMSYIEFVELLNQIKPIKEFIGKDELKGVLFRDIVMCTDDHILSMHKNIDALVNDNFFIKDTICKSLSEMTFDDTKCRVGILSRPDESADWLVISDGLKTLCIYVSRESGVPYEQGHKFWDADFNIEVEIDTKKCLSVLKRLNIFLYNIKNDNAVPVIFDLDNNVLKIRTKESNADETLLVRSNKMYKSTYNMPIKKLLKILSTVKSQTFTLSINPEYTFCVCLSFDDMKCVVAVTDDK